MLLRSTGLEPASFPALACALLLLLPGPLVCAAFPAAAPAGPRATCGSLIDASLLYDAKACLESLLSERGDQQSDAEAHYLLGVLRLRADVEAATCVHRRAFLERDGSQAAVLTATQRDCAPLLALADVHEAMRHLSIATSAGSAAAAAELAR